MKREQILRKAREHLRAALADDDEVFDPHAALAREVDARLHGDDVSSDERVRGLRVEDRLLVHVEPDPVPDAVEDGHARLLDAGARDRVDVCGLRADPDGGQGALLGGVAQGVRPPEALGERPRGEGPGAVRAVPAHLRARVDDHRLPHADPPAAGVVVRQRRVRPGGHDHGEGERLRALLAQGLLQPPGDLGLRAADERLPREPLVRGIGDPGRPPDGGELALVLDRPQPGEHAGRGHEPDPFGGEGVVTGDRDVVGFEGDRRVGELVEASTQVPEQVALRLDDLDAFDRAGGLEVAPVRGENEAVASDDERRVRALEARQVADVDRPRDEEARRSEIVQLGSQPLDALGQACSFR